MYHKEHMERNTSINNNTCIKGNKIIVNISNIIYITNITIPIPVSTKQSKLCVYLLGGSHVKGEK